jgi:hypothetical protein
MRNQNNVLQKYLLLLCCLLISLVSRSQIISYPTPAQSVSRGLDSTLLTVRIDFGTCSTNPLVTINLGYTNAPGIIQYIPGSITKTGGTAGLAISQSNISNLQIPVFAISPSPTAGNFIIFTIKRRANCGNATASKDAVFVTGGCSFNDIDPSVNPYPILDPALTLTTSAALSNVNLGTPYNRTITITNGANGCLDTLGFYIVYPAGAIQLNSLKIGATTLVPYFTNGDSTFYSITGSSLSATNKLCNGQSIILTENIIFKKCGPTTKYGANWYAHLNNDICESTIEQIGATMSNNLPILSASIPAADAYDYCMNGETKVQRVRIINNGTGPASNITMMVRSEIYYRTYGTIYFDTTVAWQVRNSSGTIIGSVSNFTNLVDMWSGNPNIPFCAAQVNTPGAIGSGKGRFSSNIILAVGEVIYVDVVTKSPNYPCEPNFCAQYGNWVTMQSQLDYTSQCGTDSYSEPYKDLLFNEGVSGNVTVENPLNVNGFAPNNTFNLSLNYTYLSNYNHPSGRGRTRVAIPLLGTGLTPTVGSVVFAGYTLSVQVINDTMFIGPFPENIVIWNSNEMVIPMQASCSGGGGVKNLNVFHLSQYDTNCSPIFKHDCGSTSIKVICPVPCSKGGATPMLFSLKRINYGQVDNNNDGLPDASGTIDQSKINVHHSVNGDTLQGVWNIKLKPNTDMADANYGGNIRYVYIDFELGTNGLGENGTLNALQNATAEVWRAGTNIANLSINPAIIGKKAHYEFSGTSLSGGFWLGNDSVVIKAKYTVNQFNSDRYDKANYSGLDLFITKNEVYSSYTQKTIPQIAPSNGQTYTCEHLDDFNQISRIWVSAYMPLEQIINGCDNTISASMRQYTREQEGGAIFPYEYRNFYIPDTLKVQLPPGFVYRPNTANFNHSYTGDPSLPISNSNIYQINDTLIFTNLKSFYTRFGGTMMAGDEVEDSRVEFSIDPTCASSMGTYTGSTSNIAKGNTINTPTSSYASDWDVFIQPNIYIYDAPLPTLTTGAPSITSTDAIASWNVVLQNISNTIDAPNSYFYITPKNGLANIVVKEGSTVITPNSNGFYLLNNLVKGANRNFTITGQTTNCSIDSIRINQGWNCNGYPTSFALQSCTKTSWLKISNYISQIQLSVTKQATPIITNCTGETVEFIMNSAQAGFIDNAVFKTTPPVGLTIASGQIEYPLGSGNWETITPSIVSGEYTYNVENHTQVQALWGTRGIPGTVTYPGADQRQVKLRLTFGLDCSFTNGSKLTIKQQAYRPCGDPISSVLGFNKTISTLPIWISTTAPCYIDATNYAITPQSGSINWNSLAWSLGRPPTCCESAHITYTGTNAGADAVTINITNDICIKNLTLLNTASTATNKLFKTIVSSGYNMVMNGYVRMTASGALATDSCIFIADGNSTITVNGNTTIGYPSDNAYCIIGSSPNAIANTTYMLRGDSLTFNAKGLTNDKYMTVVMNPVVDTAYLVNNTNVSPFPQAVSFEKLQIGNSIKNTTVIAAGSNQNAYMNNLGGFADVTSNSTFVLPANYTLNAKGINSSFIVRDNATLQLGGSSGGVSGSNFPSVYNTYNLAPTSTVLFYGASQTIPGTVNNVNTYGNIILSGTGLKTATSSSINLLGNLYRATGTHTFNANAGRVLFTSTTSPQKYYADAGVSPIDFYDFTNDNRHTNGLSIDSTIGILNEFELKPSTKITLNTGDVIMRSSAARTSYSTSFGTVNMPVITYNTNYRFVIERYLQPKKAWRFLATPVQPFAIDNTSQTIAQAWRENNSAHTSTGYGVQMTGPTGPVVASPIGDLDFYTQRGSLKYYNDAADLWTEIYNTNSTKIANNKGYMVFVRGDRGAINTTATLGAPTNLRIKGKMLTGDQIFPVLANKFQSFGNPYPSRIDMRTVTKNNIANSFTVWNPTSAGKYNVGAYETYVWNGTNYVKAGSIIRNFIESGEAVFVQSNSATAGSVIVKEADKGAGSSIQSRGGANADGEMQSRAGITEPTFEINLFAKDFDGSDYLADGVFVNFDKNYIAAIDNDDVRKINNVADNLAVKNGNTSLVADRRPMPTDVDTIKLHLSNTRIAPYRFEIDPSALTIIGAEAYLADKYLQALTAISMNDVTKYEFEINADLASKAVDRFSIIFKQTATSSFTTIAATRNADKTVAIKWSAANERNVNTYSVEQSTDGVNFITLAGTQAPTSNTGGSANYSKQDVTASVGNNWYRVKIANQNGTTTYSAVAMVGAVALDAIAQATGAISIYPNPIVNGNVNLHLDNQAKGTYQVQVSNQLGQIIKTATVQVQNNSLVKTIPIGSQAVGTYQTLIVGEDGKKTIVPFMVK